jgi:hypothetical protein
VRWQGVKVYYIMKGPALLVVKIQSSILTPQQFEPVIGSLLLRFIHNRDVDCHVIKDRHVIVIVALTHE